MMRILIIGRTGQLGWELERSLAGLGVVTAVGRDRVDLAQPDALQSALDQVQPDVIVNAAAYTAVDQAEADESSANVVNIHAPARMARWAARRSALLIHYSTDYVFDGSGTAPWREDDVPRPLCAYGRSKWDGEQAVRSSGCAHLILRTSWVYASRGRNFLRTMLRLAREREELRVVDDQIGAPTWARTVAQVTALLLARMGRTAEERRSALARRNGTYHLAARDYCSWYAFAQRIFESSPDPARRLRRLVPIPTSKYLTPASRPLNSRLAVERIEADWDLLLPRWDETLPLCLAELSAY